MKALNYSGKWVWVSSGEIISSRLYNERPISITTNCCHIGGIRLRKDLSILASPERVIRFTARIPVTFLNILLCCTLTALTFTCPEPDWSFLAAVANRVPGSLTTKWNELSVTLPHLNSVNQFFTNIDLSYS